MGVTDGNWYRFTSSKRTSRGRPGIKCSTGGQAGDTVAVAAVRLPARRNRDLRRACFDSRWKHLYRNVMPKGCHLNHARGADHPRFCGRELDRGTPLYRAWIALRVRCNNPRGQDYAYYGGKGVRVCKNWNTFEAFKRDMGPHPGKGWTLERKDGSKDYCKSNCIWATRQQQSRNRAYVKLSEEKAAEIRAAYIPGMIRQVDLAAQFGVSQLTISNIVRGKSWR
jgi:hypothetical protein